MKLLILTIFSIILIFNCSSTNSNIKNDQIPELKGWDLVWNDEFAEDGIPDSSKWRYESGPNWYNGELQYYTAGRPENVRVENGNLVIEVWQEDFGGRQYTSTRMNSTACWAYGRMELRAQLPNGNGLWPALWMMPVFATYGSWPNSGEIDIMENWSWDKPGIYGTVHTQAYNHILGTQHGGKMSVYAPWQNFYTYALEWSPEKMDWFVDDSLYFSFQNEGNHETWPFDQPFHFIINVAVEGSAPGQEYTWQKRTMEVDYVRVYKRNKSS